MTLPSSIEIRPDLELRVALASTNLVPTRLHVVLSFLTELLLQQKLTWIISKKASPPLTRN